jgi:hypothetical protein
MPAFDCSASSGCRRLQERDTGVAESRTTAPRPQASAARLPSHVVDEESVDCALLEGVGSTERGRGEQNCPGASTGSSEVRFASANFGSGEDASAADNLRWRDAKHSAECPTQMRRIRETSRVRGLGERPTAGERADRIAEP